MSEPLSSSAIRVGAVRGRYFRENFAQGGIDLVQIVPALMRAFLDEEVYDGRVRVEPERRRADGRQRSLLDD